MKPPTTTRNGVTYEARAVLRHPDGSMSARWVRQTPAPKPDGLLVKLLRAVHLL